MSSFELRAATPEVRKEHEALAAEQEAALREYVLGATNIARAMEHLELAAFRWYSHIAPVHGADGTITEFDLLDAWNISRRGSKGAWLWNPESKSGTDNLPVIPEGETIYTQAPAIDYPALFFYVAKALGIRDWGRFVERFGIPPCAITMPSFATEEDQIKYLNAASHMQLGQNTALPFGTEFSWASEARGIEPFSKMIQFLQEQVVLMATGGTLTSLAQSGSGTLAGGAHEETWKEITARSRRVNAAALFDGAGRPMLLRQFPGQPILAKIEYADEPKAKPSEVIADAAAAKAAGFEMSVEEINRRTGYNFTKAEPVAPETPRNHFQDGNRISNARESEDAPQGAENAAVAARALSAARKKDFAAVAGAIDKLLAADDTEMKTKAKALAKNLPEALEGMDAAAEVLEREMAEAFAEGGGARTQNAADDCRANDPSTCRTHGTRGGADGEGREHKTKGNSDSLGRKFDPDHPERYSERDNISRGNKAMDRVMRQKTDVPNAMYRPELGTIDFDWGRPGNPKKDYEDGYGISHIAAKHPGAEKDLPITIQKGTAYELPQEYRENGTKKPKRIAIVYDRNVAFLDYKRDGKSLAISSYKSKYARIDEIKENPVAKPRGS